MAKQREKLAICRLTRASWKEDTEGNAPVYLEVQYGKDRARYSVKYNGERLSVSTSYWDEYHDKEKARNMRGTKRQIRETLDATLAEAITIKTKIETTGNKVFTLPKFHKEYKGSDVPDGFLYKWFKDYLDDLKKEDRIGSRDSYYNAFRALELFQIDRGRVTKDGRPKDIDPFEITSDFLRAFERFLVTKRKCGKTTIGMYMRSVRVIYNLITEKVPELKSEYPFAERRNQKSRYKITTGSGHHGDALTVEQLRKFLGIKTERGSLEREAQLLWLFSFYCRGMNMKDVALLKYKDIQGETISYVRAKTKDTEAVEAVMKVPLTDPVRAIISEIGNPDKRPGSYVFTIIPDGREHERTIKRRKKDKILTDAERIKEIIKQKTKMVNQRLKLICEPEGLPAVTSYWARHTFANLSREAGGTVEEIRELLGHSNVKVTEHYLKRFDDERLKKAHERISDLLKVS